MKTELVFGVTRSGAGNETLVFIPAERALELAAIQGVIENAATWQEFAEKIPARDWNELLEGFDSPPDPDDGFDPCQIGVCDGDWPEWPEQKMMAWLPVEVWQEYGSVHDSRLNGQFLALDPSNVSELVEALARRGYVCRRDDVLVRAACGQAEEQQIGAVQSTLDFGDS
jgi:hypothetical protein